ncbi:hypothetical protein FQZ97_976820 [compost metagenome]
MVLIAALEDVAQFEAGIVFSELMLKILLQLLFIGATELDCQPAIEEIFNEPV